VLRGAGNIEHTRPLWTTISRSVRTSRCLSPRLQCMSSSLDMGDKMFGDREGGGMRLDFPRSPLDAPGSLLDPPDAVQEQKHLRSRSQTIQCLEWLSERPKTSKSSMTA
jgi:hypothetical protein